MKQPVEWYDHMQQVSATMLERAEKARAAGQTEVTMSVDESEALLADIKLLIADIQQGLGDSA